MALKIVHYWGFQSPGFPKLEALSVGLDVTCIDLAGGPTLQTGYSMQLPPEKAGRKHIETRKFAITSLSPTDFLQFGFWVYYHNVDIAAGDANIEFFQIKRNGVKDISLELRPVGAGNEIVLIDQAGTDIDVSDADILTEEMWHWFEGFYDPLFGGACLVNVDGGAALTGFGDFRGDAADLEPSVRFEGQTEAGTVDAGNSTVYVAQGYVAEDSSGVDDFLTVGGTDFECYTYRLGATTSQCDEADSDGAGDALSAGSLANTADDSAATTADYAGDAADVIGATYAFDTSPGDGPSPYWNKWDTVIYGLKFSWVLAGGIPAGTPYFARYGSHIRGSSNWDTAQVSIPNRVSYAEVLGQPGVDSFPNIPSEKEVAAIGWFVSLSTGTLKARQLYFFVFAAGGQGAGNYLMGDNKVGSKRSLVGCGGGRVG